MVSSIVEIMPYGSLPRSEKRPEEYSTAGDIEPGGDKRPVLAPACCSAGLAYFATVMKLAKP